MNIANQKFNKLIALEKVGKNESRANLWKCICECGEETVVPAYSLRSGHTKSCGCLQKEKAKEQQKILAKNCRKHGLGKHQIYNAWVHLNERINNKNCSEYRNYGGRGISCNWNTFEEFAKDMLPSYEIHLKKHGSQNTTLDRINVNGNYCFSNCRWATLKQQARNRRNNHVLKYNGKSMCVVEWAEYLRINPKTLYTRLSVGWSVEKALTTPVKSS